MPGSRKRPIASCSETDGQLKGPATHVGMPLPAQPLLPASCHASVQGPPTAGSHHWHMPQQHAASPGQLAAHAATGTIVAGSRMAGPPSMSHPSHYVCTHVACNPAPPSRSAQAAPLSASAQGPALPQFPVPPVASSSSTLQQVEPVHLAETQPYLLQAPPQTSPPPAASPPPALPGSSAITAIQHTACSPLPHAHPTPCGMLPPGPPVPSAPASCPSANPPSNVTPTSSARVLPAALLTRPTTSAGQGTGKPDAAKGPRNSAVCTAASGAAPASISTGLATSSTEPRHPAGASGAQAAGGQGPRAAPSLPTLQMPCKPRYASTPVEVEWLVKQMMDTRPAVIGLDIGEWGNHKGPAVGLVSWYGCAL